MGEYQLNGLFMYTNTHTHVEINISEEIKDKLTAIK
jgi:hypothetical protein